MAKNKNMCSSCLRYKKKCKSLRIEVDALQNRVNGLDLLLGIHKIKTRLARIMTVGYQTIDDVKLCEIKLPKVLREIKEILGEETNSAELS